MFGVEPSELTETRLQLHWASQLLSAAADAKLEKAADDSHSNLGWNAATKTLIGRAGVSLNVSEFRLEVGGQMFPLASKSLSEARHWLGSQLDRDVELRDYDMPEHSVASGAAFSPHQDQLESIASWFSFAEKALAGYGELRVWPHHFDMGFWSPDAVEGKSVGGGFSTGDHHFSRPYIYVNPYGIERPETLPELPHGGFWTEHWLGAVITSDELSESDATGQAKEFVRVAVNASNQLLSGVSA